MDRLRQDIRVALRGFRRTPSFTITAIAILAIGIGMAVAMFTVYDAVVVRNLPVPAQDRVVELFTYRDNPNTDYYLLRGDLRQVAAGSLTMRDIAGVAHWGEVTAPFLDRDRTLIIGRTFVSGNFFDVLGARPLLGRFMRPSDELPGAAPVLVLSYSAWKRFFDADPHVVGRKLVEPYSRRGFEVIGVAPAGLDYPTGVGVWMPPWQPSDNLSVIALARLAPGASVRDAQEEFFAKMRRLPQIDVAGPRDYKGVHIRTFTQAVVGNVRPTLVTLAAAVGLLLLIACVNVGNLLLVRAAGRARELSIRRALGASLGMIVRQLVIESALLGVAGGVLGFLTSIALIKLLIAAAPPKLPRLDDIAIAGTPLGMALLVTIGAVGLFGVVPALLGSSSELASPLRFDSRAGRTTRGGQRLRRALVGLQVALALVMLAGAGLLVRSLEHLQSITLGYNPEHLTLVDVTFTPNEYGGVSGNVDQRKLNNLADLLVPVWRAIPGIIGVTPALVPPFLGPGIFVGPALKEGNSPQEDKAAPQMPVEAGGTDYFRVMGIHLLRGRGFTDADREDAQYVAVVSQSAARRLWPNEDPIGKRMHYWSADTIWRTVVGVAADIRWRSLRDPTPTIYLPWRQAYWQGSFAIRTSGDVSAVLPAIRRATHEINPVLTVWEALPMDNLLAGPLAQPRLGALLLGAFAFVSMLLAAIGLYGVMAAIVTATTREIGVRAALGASPERLRRDVLAEALGMAGAGAVVGLVVALGASRLLSSLLFEVSPGDPLAVIGALVVLLLVALAAAYIPARRATRIDPATALRAD
jgi:predicted permease